MKTESWDLIIIGGGASGMAAAIAAKETAPGLQVAVLEKKEALGKKLRATGNGRCNLTNTALETAADTIAFFEGLGMPTRTDDAGRVYPFSESAPGVTEALSQTLSDLGVTVILEAPVKAVTVKAEGFKLKTSQGSFRSRALLLATGGKAGPAYGCTGDGYGLAQSLGHQVTKPLPVLTGICCAGDFKRLKGVRVKGRLSLTCGGETVFFEDGEIQFTDYGISGICAFNLSRYLKYQGEARLEPYAILLDLAPERNFTPLFEAWQKNPVLADSPVAVFLGRMVKRPLAALIAETAAVSETCRLAGLTSAAIAALDRALHRIVLKPTGTMGFKMAQCTAGGIVCDEVDFETMASKIVPGLYFAGELLDYDGPCGGYNLDHAFTTGRRAGAAAARALLQGE